MVGVTACHVSTPPGRSGHARSLGRGCAAVPHTPRAHPAGHSSGWADALSRGPRAHRPPSAPIPNAQRAQLARDKRTHSSRSPAPPVCPVPTRAGPATGSAPPPWWAPRHPRARGVQHVHALPAVHVQSHVVLVPWAASSLLGLQSGCPRRPPRTLSRFEGSPSSLLRISGRPARGSPWWVQAG